LVKPVREADTLFLPDLSSWKAVEREGGFRSMESSLVIDTAKPTGTVPSRLLGSLHPGGTPAQTRAALHVIRTDKILTATPMRRGAPDTDHPSPGKSGKFSYDWQVCDRVFDWMSAHGVEPSRRYWHVGQGPQPGGCLGPGSGSFHTDADCGRRIQLVGSESLPDRYGSL
jgi:hypothetical protein